MLKTRFGWTILLLILGLLGGAWIFFSQEPTAQFGVTDNLTEAPIAGYFAPEFTSSTTQGETLTLSDYRGQPTVLNFWASWCPPCRAEAPHFQAASLKFNGQATIIGVDQGEPLPAVADFGALMGLSYPLVLDEDSSINRMYGVAALPTTVFIDADGIIQEVYTGIINQAVLEERVERLLKEG
jgi:peroxiredoxin